MSVGRRAVTAMCAVLLLTFHSGCHEGAGSDLGPGGQGGSRYDYRVAVSDNAGRPVVGARVTFSGSSASAATGTTGRAFFYQALDGERVLTVDGDTAAATENSRLGRLSVAATPPSGDELPYVFYLPDHGSSVGLLLNTGVQPGASVLADDPAAAPANPERSDAVLTVGAGETVTHGAAATVELRTAQLSPGHLPLLAAGFPVLASRAVYLHPPEVTFVNGADLSIPNDLGLSSGQAVGLFWLDPSTGHWIDAGLAAEAGGRMVATGRVFRGGLYAFGLVAGLTTEVSGRVLDADDEPLDGVLVRGPEAFTRSGQDGRFILPAIARTDARNVDRTVNIELHAGRQHLPEAMTRVVTLNAANLDLGDLRLPTEQTTNLRLLLINRGQVVTQRRFRVGGREFPGAGTGVLDSEGFVGFEEIPAGVVAYTLTQPRDEHSVFRARSELAVDAGVDSVVTIFATETQWRSAPADGTLLEVVDKAGSGALPLAFVVTDDVPGLGFAGQTDLNGNLGVGVARTSVATGIFESTLGGRKTTSAFTAAATDGGRVEVPLERARTRRSPFARFGMFHGDLTGAAAGPKDRQLRVTGSMTRQDYYDLVLRGTRAEAAPTPLLPTSTDTGFRVGVPVPSGHLAAMEGTITATGFVPERFGVVVGVQPIEGELTLRDVPMVPSGNVPFGVSRGVLRLDPSILAADLRVQLAGELPTGLLIDLARDVGGISVFGDDASVMLPALPAGFDRYIAMLGGTALSGGATVQQYVVAPFDGITTPDVAQLPVPVVTSPAPGATVSGGGFTIDFQLPLGCQYGLVQLRSETGNDILDWTVIVPVWWTQVRFFSFPNEVPQVLTPGRNWTVTVSAVRIDSGELIDPSIDQRELYGRILGNFVGMTDADRRASAFSSIRFPIQTN